MPKLKIDSLLTKYIFKVKEVKSNGSPRPGTMKPRKGEKLSLFEVTEMKHIQICDHGRKNVDNPEKQRTHIGYVNFKYESIKNLELDAVYDNNPLRHVSIGFPDNDEKRRELAKALASEVISIDINAEKEFFASCC